MAEQCRPYLPPEWAPQSGVMLTWPHVHGDWAKRLSQVEPVFTEIARQISWREKVLISCYDHGQRERLGDHLAAAGVDMRQAILRTVPSNDAWARDHGPLTVTCRNDPLLLDFGFNGWGGKYGYDLDNQVSRKLYITDSFGQVPMQTLDLVLEGGSIEVDGAGTLLTTARCLLAPTRNPRLTREQLEKNLKESLGLTRILWLNHGYLAGDDTDSHIDTLARYCDKNTIAYVNCDDPRDEHYAELKAMEDELKGFRAANNQPYRLMALPWPRAIFDETGQRLPATYANFLIINGAVLVPTYDDPADKVALERLKQCFPTHEVVAINCLPLIYQFGSLHCVTMQLPEGVIPK
ncbi:MAG: agmatine deiminase family protein [Sulfuricaulis sp.]